MLIRHEKELEQIKRMNQRKEEDLVKRQVVEKRALPKRIRTEMKAREMMFRESMRISLSYQLNPEEEREKLKKVNFYLLINFYYKGHSHFFSFFFKRKHFYSIIS